MWIPADIPPIESGYFMTYYYNSDEKAYLFKAIYWYANEMKWCDWRPTKF